MMSLLDQGKTVDMAYLDFNTTFDWFPHDVLMSKLENFRLDTRVVRWVGNQLKNDNQRVVVDGISSVWRAVSSGVSKDLILGLILSNIFINDLEGVEVEGQITFSDDTKLGEGVNISEDRGRI